MPCYVVSELIFSYLIQKKIPVFFVIRQIAHSETPHAEKAFYFLLVGDTEKKGFTITRSSDYLLHHCVVVSGDVKRYL